MKKALQVAMFSLFTVIGFNAQANEHHHETMSEAQPQVISATGEVKGIDLESKKITIHHDPIAAVNWPEMTMRFTITPQTKMSELKPATKWRLILSSRATFLYYRILKSASNPGLMR